MTIDKWLRDMEVPEFMVWDTRQITKKIRSKGTVKCVISTEGISISEAAGICDKAQLRGDWMKEVAVKEKTVLEPLADQLLPGSEGEPFDVAVIDFGVKGNILTCSVEEELPADCLPWHACGKHPKSQ